ncbi:hypothetical protein D1872_291240 [compost metagenome]
MVRAVNACHDHEVGFLAGDHFIELIGTVCRHFVILVFVAQHLIGIVHPGLVDIAKCDQLRCFAEIAGQRSVEEFGTTSGTDQCIAFFVTHVIASLNMLLAYNKEARFSPPLLRNRFQMPPILL